MNGGKSHGTNIVGIMGFYCDYLAIFLLKKLVLCV